MEQEEQATTASLNATDVKRLGTDPKIIYTRRRNTWNYPRYTMMMMMVILCSSCRSRTSMGVLNPPQTLETLYKSMEFFKILQNPWNFQEISEILPGSRESAPRSRRPGSNPPSPSES